MSDVVSKLIANGYRRVSNRGKILSRVDREDWKNFMAIQHSPWSLEEGLEWVENMGDGAADQYRRVYSKDCIVVAREVYSKIPNSNWDPIGFALKKGIT